MPRLIKDYDLHVGHTPDRVEDIHKKKVDSLIEDQLLDDTMYGEVIPSLMGWTSPDEQELKVNKLEELSGNTRPIRPKETIK